MGLTEDYHKLNNVFNLNDSIINIPGNNLSIHNYLFESTTYGILPEYTSNVNEEKNSLSIQVDSEILENKLFRYAVFKPSGIQKFKKAIILLHGLNERNWSKYLVWAKYLVENTSMPVILFPVAFHMNRSPGSWTDRRSMSSLLQKRLKKYPDDSGASYVNVAISERLGSFPERFVHSGYQTINDIIDLTKKIHDGLHPLFEKKTNVNFFGYSIGAFISQVIMIANPDNLYKDSKFVLFCGGSVFNKIDGISRYIMDSIAFEKISTLYRSENEWTNSSKIFNQLLTNKIGTAFRALLSLNKLKKIREKAFKNFSQQIYAISLIKDKVFKEKDIFETLKGTKGKIPLALKAIDFPYHYTHEIPFPITTNIVISTQVDYYFEQLFKGIANFFKQQ